RNDHRTRRTRTHLQTAGDVLERVGREALEDRNAGEKPPVTRQIVGCVCGSGSSEDRHMQSLLWVPLLKHPFDSKADATRNAFSTIRKDIRHSSGVARYSL